MGALASAAGNNKMAEYHYQNTLRAAPHDVLARSDYALQLARTGKLGESVDELKKTFLITREQPTVHNNLGAVLARRGDYKPALEHTTRAMELAPQNSVNHRNCARIQSLMGDTRGALKHNLESVAIDSRNALQGGGKPNSLAYRAAAVQIIALGGDRNEAHRLMDAARSIEGKKHFLGTTERTNEILSMIMTRVGDKEEALKKEAAALEAAKKATQDRLPGGDAISSLRAGTGKAKNNPSTTLEVDAHD